MSGVASSLSATSSAWGGAVSSMASSLGNYWSKASGAVSSLFATASVRTSVPVAQPSGATASAIAYSSVLRQPTFDEFAADVRALLIADRGIQLDNSVIPRYPSGLPANTGGITFTIMAISGSSPNWAARVVLRFQEADRALLALAQPRGQEVITVAIGGEGEERRRERSHATKGIWFHDSCLLWRQLLIRDIPPPRPAWPGWRYS